MKGDFVLTGFTLLGVLVGWLLHAAWISDTDNGSRSFDERSAGVSTAPHDLRTEDDISHSSYKQRLKTAKNPSDLEQNRNSLSFQDLLDRIDSLEKQGDFPGAIDHLMQAALVISTDAETSAFENSLARLVDHAARELVAQGRYGVLDQLYERLTLELPEFAEYYLKLALLRIRMGNESDALLPLAQIENHSQYGAQARKLLLQLEETQTVYSLVNRRNTTSG